jgi:hypothetical protein
MKEGDSCFRVQERTNRQPEAVEKRLSKCPSANPRQLPERTEPNRRGELARRGKSDGRSE